MPPHRQIAESRHSVKELFDMIADIERYPEFLPWCRAARITRRESETVLYAELVISFKHLTESYLSRVTLTPPDEDAQTAAIRAEMVSGPFEHLLNEWKFRHGTEDKTFIDFYVDFRFRSKLLDAMIGPLFARASEKMATAFAARAEALYGSH